MTTTARKPIFTNLPPRWAHLRYHPQQYEAFHSNTRFVNLACGRRSGKTELARRKIINALMLRKPWKKPVYFYALPTYNQAKRVAWRELVDLIPKWWIDPKHGGFANIMDLHIRTVFGSELYVLGMDQPQRIEGLGYDGGVVDEACDHKPDSFSLSIRPALSDRNGWCWRIGVPKRTGTCSREYKEYWEMGFSDEHPDIKSYSWPSADIVNPEEIAAAKRTMDAKDFNEQYNASWEQAGGLIFYTFDDKKHVNDEICQYRPHLPLYIGMDFNVDPMAWVIGQVLDDHPLCPRGEKMLVILDELFIRNTTTPQSLAILYKKWAQHKERVYFCGDASSASRKTSASLSDYQHIVNFNPEGNWADRKVIVPRKNPAIADRFSVCNSAILNADMEIRFYCHSRCKRLIADLNYRAYKEGTSDPNDSADIGHISDGLGYLMYYLFPMRFGKQQSQSIAIQAF